MNYYISGGYQNQDGLIIGSGFERFNLRANTDAQLSERLRVGVNIAPSFAKHLLSNNEGNPWDGGGTVIFNALAANPLVPVYCEENAHPLQLNRACSEPLQRYGDQITWGLGHATQRNPMAVAREVHNELDRFRILSNAFIDFSLRENVNVRTSFGADVQSDHREFYRPAEVDRWFSNSNGWDQRTQRYNLLSENTITLAPTNIGNNHRIGGVVGFTAQIDQWEQNQINATNFPNDLVRTMNAGEVTGGYSTKSQWALLSFLGRINYGYDDRYLVTATFRADGSSRFGAENRWGFFPSISAAWVISEEAFMRETALVSNLRLRGSYGITGNFNIPNYGHIAGLSQSNAVFGEGRGSLRAGVAQSSLSNPNLGWERSKQLDLGLEIGFFEDRFSLIVDYCNSTTDDLLLNVPIPEILGFTTALTNIGKVKNQGWEFTLKTQNNIREFLWTSDFNLSWNRNEVLALGPEDDPIITGRHITMVGEVLGSYYGWLHDGIYQSWEEIEARCVQYPSGREPEPGDPRLVDVNGDGRIDTDDRTILGNNEPDFMFGFNNNFFYRNFDFRINIQGMQGNYVMNEKRLRLGELKGQFNQFADVSNYWRSQDNPGDGVTPKPHRDTPLLNHEEPGPYAIEDASFIRINNVTLGYRLPNSLVQSIFLQDARIYFSIQNAYTFTKYDAGYNPEVSHHGQNPLMPGRDMGGYPLPRTFTFGIKVGL